jgi:hypothetical protein
MLRGIIGEKPLPVEVTQHIVAKSDGVPLFVEEITRMVVEAGLVKERDGAYELLEPLLDLAIPATLRVCSWLGSIVSGQPNRWCNWVPHWGENFPMNCFRLSLPWMRQLCNRDLPKR